MKKIILCSILVQALVLLCIGLIVTTTYATTITSVYDSKDDLDLEGSFHSAVNFGGTTSVDVVIDDATFKPIPLTLTGVSAPTFTTLVDNVKARSIGSPGRIRNPGGTTTPSFPAGNTALETISGTVALTDGGSGPSPAGNTTMEIVVENLIAGQQYKMQLLFFDVFQDLSALDTGDRLFDIDIMIGGNLEIASFDIIANTGDQSLFGAAVTHWFTGPADTSLEIQLIPQSTQNFSPMISAMTVEAVPEPTTIALLGIGLAGLAGAEVRRRRKKKVVDKS